MRSKRETSGAAGRRRLVGVGLVFVAVALLLGDVLGLGPEAWLAPAILAALALAVGLDPQRRPLGLRRLSSLPPSSEATAEEAEPPKKPVGRPVREEAP